MEELLIKELEWYRKRYTYPGEKRGLHNIKNLWGRWPNLYEWVILIILLLMMFIAYSYNNETAMCRDTLQRIPDIACKICSHITSANATSGPINLSNYLKIELPT